MKTMNTMNARFRKTDERGMVAIVVTLIMIFIITLIVLGFSEATRRNQRESLDSQLGMQAYYAAETGVNDVSKALKTSPTPLTNQTTCAPPYVNGTLAMPRALNTDGTVANTCLLINTQPSSLVIDTISKTTGSVVWKVKNASGGNFSSLKFAWAADTATTLPASCSLAFRSYPTTSGWLCNRALLRIDILPTNPGSSEAAALANTTTTLFLQPTASTQQNISLNSFTDPTARAWQGACAVSADPANPGCAVNVSFNGTTPRSEYYIRITATYVDAKKVTLTGMEGATPTKFADGQIMVDSTGKAQDQIKRIQVRVPVGGSRSDMPVFGVQSAGSTCKDILYYGTTSYNSGECAGLFPGL